MTKTFFCTNISFASVIKSGYKPQKSENIDKMIKASNK